MLKLSKEQQALLECALDKIYSFLEVKFNVKYQGNHMIIVCNNDVEFTQYSLKDRIAWFVFIDLEQRTVHLVKREVERDSFRSKHRSSLNYMSSQSDIFKLQF